MSRRSLAILVGILAVAFAVRLVLFTGYRNGDMGNYLQEAHNWSVGEYSLSRVLEHRSLDEMIPGPKFNWQNLRLGMIVPVATVYGWFGVGNAAFVVPMFLSVALGAFVTFRFGSDLGSETWGLAAAAFYLFVPIEINLATTLVPHIPTSAVTALGAWALWRGVRTNGARRFAWCALAGAAVATAYAIWEFSILMVGVFGLFWLARLWDAPAGERLRELAVPLGLAAGFLPLFAVETLYFYRLSGVPFFRQAFISQLSPLWLELHPADRAFLALDRFPRAMAGSYHFGLFYYFVFAGLVWALVSWLRRRNERLRSPLLLPLLWFVLLLGYLQFGTSSFSSYQPVYKLNHYLGVVTIPGALFAAYGLTRVAGRLPQRLRVPSLVLALAGFAASSTLCAWVLHVGNGPYRRDVTHELEMRAALDELPEAGTVYTDHWTKDGLDFVYGYGRPIVAFTAIANLPPPPFDAAALRDGHVLINRRYLAGEHTMATDVPAWIDAPPASWRLETRLGEPGGGVEIYRAGASR